VAVVVAVAVAVAVAEVALPVRRQPAVLATPAQAQADLHKPRAATGQ
jgi:hypothetical protein